MDSTKMKKPSKLDINKNPERFSHLDRAREYDRFLHHEFGWGEPTVADGLFGCSDYSGISTPAFLEGFMAALAFCSGAISGGKLREFSKWSEPLDVMTLNKFAQSCMERQTLWDKNPELNKDNEVGI